jgi:hypothetical protein
MGSDPAAVRGWRYSGQRAVRRGPLGGVGVERLIEQPVVQAGHVSVSDGIRQDCVESLSV